MGRVCEDARKKILAFSSREKIYYYNRNKGMETLHSGGNTMETYATFLIELDNRNNDSRITDFTRSELESLGIHDDTYRRWDEDNESYLERMY